MRNSCFAALVATMLASGALTAGHALAATADKTEVVSLRRLTQSEYRNSIADIFGPEIVVQGSFEPTVRIGGLEAASTAVLSITPSGFEAFSKMAYDIAAQVSAEKYRAKLPCAPKSAKEPDDVCMAQVLTHYGQSLYRRPLTQAELKNAVSLSHNLAKSAGDFYAGLRYGLASLIQSPEFLFRKEIAISADGNTYALEPYSRATRLSYLMWNSTPDSELLAAAQRGDLSTPAGLDKQVNRLMASPRLDVGMRGFFTDMLELDNFDTVSKDGVLYPKWGSVIGTSAREETLRTAIDMTLHADGDIRDLMTTHKTILNRNLAAVYQVPFPFEGGEWMPYEFSADSGRSGVLTQVSMLSMFSHPGRSSPTERGVALMDIFLCEPTPPPPADVDFSLINDVNNATLRTTRQRLMAHASNKTCASCHTHSDPIGLTLEGFDTIGGRRTMEDGKPIDVSGVIQGKAFRDGQGLGQYLHDNPRYPACMARKLYAYARGQNSGEVQASAFTVAYKAFTDSGYHLRTLLKGLVEGPDFFNAPAPKPEAPKPEKPKTEALAKTTAKVAVE
jgi:hypothetical protein